MEPYLIKEFARAVCGYNSPDPFLAMLVAFFDESGIHDHSTVISVGGLIGRMREWDRLEKPWRQNLERPWLPKDLWFHAYECEEGVKQFEGVDRPFRDALVNGLSIALCDRMIGYVGGAVYRSAWDNIATPKLREAYGGSPYAFCVATAMVRAADFAQKVNPGERAALVFALPDLAAKQLAIEVHDKLMGEGYPGIGALSFSTPQELIQIQAADLIAFEIYQQLRSTIVKGLGNFEARSATQRFVTSGKPMWINYMDDEGMEGVLHDYPHLR